MYAGTKIFDIVAIFWLFVCLHSFVGVSNNIQTFMAVSISMHTIMAVSISLHTLVWQVVVIFTVFVASVLFWWLTLPVLYTQPVHKM